jgi:hypothetical protein
MCVGRAFIDIDTTRGSPGHTDPAVAGVRAEEVDARTRKTRVGIEKTFVDI